MKTLTLFSLFVGYEPLPSNGHIAKSMVLMILVTFLIFHYLGSPFLTPKGTRNHTLSFMDGGKINIHTCKGKIRQKGDIKVLFLFYLMGFKQSKVRCPFPTTCSSSASIDAIFHFFFSIFILVGHV